MADHLKYDPITGHLLRKTSSGHLIYDCTGGGCDCASIDTLVEAQAAVAVLTFNVDAGPWQGSSTTWSDTQTDISIPYDTFSGPGGSETVTYTLVSGAYTYIVTVVMGTFVFGVRVHKNELDSPADGGADAAGSVDALDACGDNGTFTDFTTINYGEGLAGSGTFTVKLCPA